MIPDDHLLSHVGLAGPWPLSSISTSNIINLTSTRQSFSTPQNIHLANDAARSLIHDPAIIDKVSFHFGTGYRLWRTNLFQRFPGNFHPGVGWHHDKHFQSANIDIDFSEFGHHLSVLIALDQIDLSNGIFQYLPASHIGYNPQFMRDSRPYHLRPYQDHYLPITADTSSTAIQMLIPKAHFCLFHSALIHGSASSIGKYGRTSMVGRLAHTSCSIPPELCDPQEVIEYC